MLALRDSAGRLSIGPARSADDEQLFALGATSFVYRLDGSRWGVYVDDLTPGRVAVALALAALKPGVVLVGYRPGQGSRAKLEAAGCLVALEWYPYAYFFDPFPLPRFQAYIFARDFAGNGRVPTRAERSALYAWARVRFRPRLILWY